MPVIAGFALALSAAVSNGAVPVAQAAAPVTTTVQASMPASQSVEQYVRTYFADEPLLAEIAGCESHFRQFDQNGHVIKNPTSSAVGIFQIMSSIHGSFADDKLGLDIYSLQGNAAYARYLYDREGATPWAASKSCWSKTAAYKNLHSGAVVAINK